MTSRLLDPTSTQTWDDEIAHSTQMFFEADRLETQAYQIIESYSGDAATWALFTEAKKAADTQRTAACREWMRLQRAMGK